MVRHWKSYISEMGPGWVVGAVACGPATLASLCIAGASFGFRLLWVVILSALLGATAQYLAARIGIIDSRGIISTARVHLGNIWAWTLALDALLATCIASVVLMSTLAGITSSLTNIKSPWLGFGYAAVISFLLIRGGYRWFENVCKLLVTFVVACFLITALDVDVPVAAVIRGLVPNLPRGLESALMTAAILGGAVHVTIIGMHTYNTNIKNWTVSDLGLARFDNAMSMGVAFGLYSLAIYTVAAGVLHPNNIKVTTATHAAISLGPLLGKKAMLVFLVGLWAATFSTICPTFLATAYFVCDAMRWEINTGDRRFICIILATTALSAFGPFLKGSFFLLLPLMLALGLCGTPFILAIILYLLNKKEVAGVHQNSISLNVLGMITLFVTLLLALRFVIFNLSKLLPI